MLSLIQNHKVISIIGMAKNVGKTTTLNYLLKQLINKKSIGLTSIGRDGEKIDVVTNTDKPLIYVQSGTIIATTKRCLHQSDFTKKVLETTDIQTPLGEVVIVEALSDGVVDLAGPSMNSDLKKIINIFHRYQVDLTLVDGAINRKGFASDEISDACILCTGAAYSSQMDKVIKDTKHIVNLFRLETVAYDIKDQMKTLLSAPVSLITKDGKQKQLKIKTALNAGKIIINHLDNETEYLVIKGALTDDLIKVLVNNRHRFSQLKIIVTHPTKCLFSAAYVEQLALANIKIQVLNQTKLLCVSINPVSPYGVVFDSDVFKSSLDIKQPIINVMRDAYE